MKNWITAQQAADELGVSPSTLKRFCDTNEIPIARTPGGHRRIDRSHVAQVSRLMRHRGNTSTAAEYPDVVTIVQLLLAAEHTKLTELIWAATHSIGEMVTRLEDLFVPALWRIGDMWQKNEIEIAQERVCTFTASVVLDGILGRMPPAAADARVYLGATFPPSLDTTGLKIVAIGLQSLGVEFIHLGCCVSPEVIARAAILYNASAVCISHTHIHDLDQVARDHHELAKRLPDHCKVIIGGGGLSPLSRRQIGQCEYYESVQLLVQGEGHAVLR